MRGGTYAEALKVGFTPEQSGFLGRLGGETRQEAIEDVFERLEEHKRDKAQEAVAALKNRIDRSFFASLGFVLGIVATLLVMHL